MHRRTILFASVIAVLPLERTQALSARLSSAAHATTSSDPRANASTRRQTLASIRSWAIQLRSLDRPALAASPADLIVIDHATHQGLDTETPFTSDEIAPLKRKQDGSRRLVLAYLSIGEAESYRYYWKPDWQMATNRPSWLGAENQRWPGDFRVDYANPEWQSLIFGTPESYLDRVIAAGFDGVYLDRVDAFQDPGRSESDAADAMIGFLTRLADHARRRYPKFLIIMQNGEELARSRGLLSRLDGIAKEDLLYGSNNTDDANSAQMVRDSLQFLRRARKAGLTVFLLEYPSEPAKIAAVTALARREGFLPYVTDRTLRTLSRSR
jgi:cysteinyl-tRNA synthetase